MEVVSPGGMFVYTAVYMLGADGAVFDTPEKKSMVRGTPKPKHPNHQKKILAMMYTAVYRLAFDGHVGSF